MTTHKLLCILGLIVLSCRSWCCNVIVILIKLHAFVVWM